MNRSQFEPPFSRSSIPAWKCPTCNAGTLHRADKKVLINETTDSRRNHDHPDWDPEWVRSNFFTLLRCSSPACREYVHVVGTTHVQPSYNEEYGHCMEEFLFPLFINPSIVLIDIPKNCPSEVNTDIVAASSLYWLDHSASANCLRRALESLLDHQKIPKTKINNSGKRINLKLHERILKYQNKHPEISTKLMAVKWLGNIGSHKSDMGRGKLLDAFELIEYALEEIYEKKRSRLENLARKINKRKGK
jgi:hypothetical protein